MIKNRPNILFFFPDQHRFDWIGANRDIPVRTPNLDKLGEQGVRFTNAITPSPLCSPARACLAAGKEYTSCRVPGNNDNYPLDQTTFYTLLRESGYHTAACGKFDLNKGSFGWGLDGKNLMQEWGFSDGINNEGKMDGVQVMLMREKEPTGPYNAFLAERGLVNEHSQDLFYRYIKSAIFNGNWASTYTTSVPADAYCDNWLAQNGLDLMEKFPEGKPWFLQVNFNGPHQPLDITDEMKTWYEGVEFPQPNDEESRTEPYAPFGFPYYKQLKKGWHEPGHPGKPHTEQQNNEVRQNYSAMVENIDRWLGKYMEVLEERGELENTIIVYSSDHGDMLGDHGYWEKHRPYHSCLGVPLVMAGPEIQKGIVQDGPTTLLDLTATFLDYGNVEIPNDMDSLSMRSLLEGKTTGHRDYVYSALEEWRLVFDGRFKLAEGFGADPLLFDLQNDPGENHNIATENPSKLSELSDKL